ncbi:MAG TPA: FAD binding domain-containing protein [Stellaceae bacterium]|jgi:CO/xanthine dehydrogenase FAD-binding subunit|nr:FAD binding domain-containing protein [Stellaceae bacterium]
MKAADFDYVRAQSVAEACRLLDGAAGDGKIIAGGQTLVPLLAMRLARPALVVDIAGIADIQGIADETQSLAIGAATRQADALADPALARRLPLLAKGLRMVGHPQTRNRGTIGGSLANADPAAEIGLVARTLDAELVLRSSKGERVVPIAEFFLGAMTTVLSTEECLTRVRFPVWRDTGRIGTGFEEMSLRRSDFALVAASCQLALDTDRVCRRLALAIGGAEPAPRRFDAAEARLVGTRLEPGDLAAASRAVEAALDPITDAHASADYRRRVAGVLAVRAIEMARDEALGPRV